MVARLEVIRELLREGDFRLLLTAQFLAQAADGLAQAALADALVLGEPLSQGTPGQVLRLFAVTLIPYSLIGPFSGVFVDRWPRRALMSWANLLRGGMLVTIPLWARAFGENEALYTASLLLLAFGRLFLTTKGAALPSLLHEHHLLQGNALSGGGGMIAALTGGAIGIAAVGFLSPTNTFALGGLLYLGASAVSTRISDPLAHPHPPSESLREQTARILAELVEGLQAIWAHIEVRLPLIGIFVVRTVGIFVAISAVLVIKTEFPVDERFGQLSSSALALGAAGVGAFVGAATAPIVGHRFTNAGLILLGFVVSGAGIVVLGGVVDIRAVLALTFLGGYGGFVSKVATDAQVQQALPDEMRGRAFALYDILYNLASVAAAMVMVAFGGVDLRILLVATGVVTLIAAGALAHLLSRAGLLHTGVAASEQ